MMVAGNGRMCYVLLLQLPSVNNHLPVQTVSNEWGGGSQLWELHNARLFRWGHKFMCGPNGEGHKICPLHQLHICDPTGK